MAQAAKGFGGCPDGPIATGSVARRWERLGLLIIVLYLLLLAMWVWMLVDCATKEPSTERSKTVWILVVALLGPVGALIYFVARRPKRRRLYGA